MKTARLLVPCVTLGIGLLILGAMLVIPWSPFTATAQEPKRFQYKIVEVLSDTQTMQTTLNQYGNDGWELVAVGMGDLTSPRLIFKK